MNAENGITASHAAGGLEAVVAADTWLSEVDGEAGRLIIAGFEVGDLAANAGFEQAFARLWIEATRDDRSAVELEKAFRSGLGSARVRAFERLDRLGDALGASDGMDALRAAVAHLRPTGDPLRDSLDAVGAIAVYAAASHRLRAGGAPIAPDPGAAHAGDYLRMVRGEPATALSARALDAYLVTVIDHGMNASTFAARVVASTGSDLISAVVAGIGALKGPLHGGAPGPVLDMLEAVGDERRAAAWIAGELSAGRRIMGMGHRIYRVRDPRAEVLERAVRSLEAEATDRDTAHKLALARAIEEEAVRALSARYPGRRLCANVEFYTAVLLDALGLPRELFTPTFAASRAAGWCAHIEEQRRTGRLIRPASHYVGRMPA
jgi:citrate synthase